MSDGTVEVGLVGVSLDLLGDGDADSGADGLAREGRDALPCVRYMSQTWSQRAGQRIQGGSPSDRSISSEIADSGEGLNSAGRTLHLRPRHRRYSLRDIVSQTVLMSTQ